MRRGVKVLTRRHPRAPKAVPVSADPACLRKKLPARIHHDVIRKSINQVPGSHFGFGDGQDVRAQYSRDIRRWGAAECNHASFCRT